MSKNVSVKEGNIARKFRPVDRLNVVTDNEHGMWKPESAFKLGTLHVSENGIYIASLNGYAAYSEIDVRVTDKLGSDDPDSYDYITPDPENYPDVWNPDTGDWDETELNDPDEWELPEEFDETDLDLDETEFDPYDPENSLDDFDPSDLDISNIKLEDPKLPKETKLKGIDPDTGLETEVTGIENEDGDMELSTEILPSAIHIVVPPRKRKYKEGETIDLSGIHVYLLDDRHKLFTCLQYPTGEIPIGELMYDPMFAEGDPDSGEEVSGDGINAIYLSPSPDPDTEGASYFGTVGGVRIRCSESVITGVFFTRYTDSDNKDRVYISTDGETNENYGALWLSKGEPGEEGYQGLATQFAPGNNEFTSIHTASINPEWWGWVPSSITNPSNKNPDNLRSTGITVTVSWMRSDGEILEDTFTIEIVAEGEDTEGEEQPQADPYVGYADISSNGHFYNINRKKVPQIHYANGYVWQEGISTEYSVEQAASLGLIILVR